MKGMLDFLERAGLVTRDSPAESASPDLPATPAADASALEPMTLTPVAATASVAVADAPSDGAGNAPSPAAISAAPLDLDTLYANAGIAPAQYPAERLLRLLDGLSTMDQATRLMAIKAMDAADESWTIADPLGDAAAKVAALAAHGDDLQRKLQQLEAQTQNQLDSVLSRQEKVVGDIHKQISELEALVARELARTEQETAAKQASLQAARDQTAAELAAIAQTSARLQSLATQFGASQQPIQE